jgi:hypothetical protein
MPAGRYRCPLNRLPASRLLLPRSGLERSDFVPWPIASFCGNAAVQSVSDRVTTRQIKRLVRSCDATPMSALVNCERRREFQL